MVCLRFPNAAIHFRMYEFNKIQYDAHRWQVPLAPCPSILSIVK